MGRFIGFGNCKNCSKRFKKKSLGSKYCSPGCRSSFNLKQENDKKRTEAATLWDENSILELNCDEFDSSQTT